MRVVVDANVMLAMLIKPGEPIDAFFHHRLDLYAPQLLFDEFQRHKEEIVTKSRLDAEQFDWLFTLLKHAIMVVPEEEFLSFREKAEGI